MRSLSFGLKTWPQWAGWGICPTTGALYDPQNNCYPREHIASAFMALRAGLDRDRVMWSDTAERRRLGEVDDVRLHPRPLQQNREQRNEQHLRVLHMAGDRLRY